MKNMIIALFSILCLCARANAGENFPPAAMTASDIKAAIGTSSIRVPAPQRQVLTAYENQQLYLSGAAERARLDKEARLYVKAGKERPALASAFISPTPAGVKDPAAYAALREKNDKFIRNAAYWREQINGNYGNLSYALRVNDLATSDILINHMRRDHWAIINETAAIEENNRKASHWPMRLTNEQLYGAGARERASILEQASVCADLEGRDVPKNAFVTPAPAGTADPAGYEELRAKNAGFIANIEYWRYQLEGNYANLKDDIKANDLETSRILLEYMKKDSAALDNEIKAVEQNNAEAARL